MRTDTLVEGLLGFLRDPRNWTGLWRWPLRGPAALKRQVAARAPLDLTLLPYEHTLIDYLQTQRGRGRRLVLATAADRELADGVNAHLKLFDEIIASDGIRNLKGRAKGDALWLSTARGYMYDDPIVYAARDLVSWLTAATALVVFILARGFDSRVG